MGRETNMALGVGEKRITRSDRQSTRVKVKDEGTKENYIDRLNKDKLNENGLNSCEEQHSTTKKNGRELTGGTEKKKKGGRVDSASSRVIDNDKNLDRKHLNLAVRKRNQGVGPYVQIENEGERFVIENVDGRKTRGIQSKDGTGGKRNSKSTTIVKTSSQDGRRRSRHNSNRKDGTANTYISISRTTSQNEKNIRSENGTYRRHTYHGNSRLICVKNRDDNDRSISLKTGRKKCSRGDYSGEKKRDKIEEDEICEGKKGMQCVKTNGHSQYEHYGMDNLSREFADDGIDETTHYKSPKDSDTSSRDYVVCNESINEVQTRYSEHSKGIQNHNGTYVERDSGGESVGYDPLDELQSEMDPNECIKIICLHDVDNQCVYIRKTIAAAVPFFANIMDENLNDELLRQLHKFRTKYSDMFNQNYYSLPNQPTSSVNRLYHDDMNRSNYDNYEECTMTHLEWPKDIYDVVPSMSSGSTKMNSVFQPMDPDDDENAFYLEILSNTMNVVKAFLEIQEVGTAYVVESFKA